MVCWALYDRQLWLSDRDPHRWEYSRSRWRRLFGIDHFRRGCVCCWLNLFHCCQDQTSRIQLPAQILMLKGIWIRRRGEKHHRDLFARLAQAVKDWDVFGQQPWPMTRRRYRRLARRASMYCITSASLARMNHVGRFRKNAGLLLKRLSGFHLDPVIMTYHNHYGRTFLTSSGSREAH